MASSSVVIVASFLLVSFVLSSWGTSIKMPPECEGQQYCETKPDNYPELDHIVKELQTKEFLRVQRYDDELKERKFYDDLNCNTKVKVIRPFTIQTNSTLKFVVQTNVFEQRIKTTECLKEGSECFKGKVGLSYNTNCTTTLGTIKMYLYDPSQDEKNRLENVNVEFPVCCSCSIKSDI